MSMWRSRGRSSMRLLLALLAGAALSSAVQVNPQQVLVLQKWAAMFNQTFTPDLGWAKPWTCGAVSNVKCDEQGNVVALIFTGDAGQTCRELVGSDPEVGPPNCPTRTKLIGPIPTFVGDIQTLTMLDLSGQIFNGTIPPQIYNLPGLQFLSLRQNMVTDGFTTSIAKLKKLTYLDASSNILLQSNIPTEIGTLTGLAELRLGFGLFQGVLPPAFGQLKELQYFSIGGSRVKGQIPQSYSNLNKLTELQISGSSVTGPIPPYIGNFANLSSLSIKQCNMTGEVPDTLSKLTAISILDLSYNPLLGGELSPGLSQLANIVPPQNSGLQGKYIYFGSTNTTCPVNTKAKCMGPPPVNTTSQFCLWVCNDFCAACGKGTYNNSKAGGGSAGDEPYIANLEPPSPPSTPPSPPPVASPFVITDVYASPPPPTTSTESPKGQASSYSSSLLRLLLASVWVIFLIIHE